MSDEVLTYDEWLEENAAELMGVPESDYSTARARIDRIAGHVEAARQDIIAAYHQRDWIALGYESWQELCEAEFRGAMIALPRADRRDAVAEMTDAGMSTRAIGAALGVGVATVHRDRDAGVPNGTPDEPPAPVTGIDGKTYTRPTKKVTVVEEVTVDAETGEIVEPPQDIEAHPFVANDSDYRNAVIRRDLMRHVKNMGPPVAMTPQQAAAALAGSEGELDLILRARQSIDEWCDQLQAELEPKNRLRIVGDDR